MACAKPKRLTASRPRSTAATCLAAVLWHPEVCRCAYVAPDHEVNQTCLCTCVCIDCCCFYYFIRNSKVALLEALSDRVCVCNCAYMYMRVRIYTYVYICTYMCVWVHVHIYILLRYAAIHHHWHWFFLSFLGVETPIDHLGPKRLSQTVTCPHTHGGGPAGKNSPQILWAGLHPRAN